MKDISYWVKRIEEDIYEPDKIIIDIGHLRKLLNTTHNSSSCGSADASPNSCDNCFQIKENCGWYDELYNPCDKWTSRKTSHNCKRCTKDTI